MNAQQHVKELLEKFQQEYQGLLETNSLAACFNNLNSESQKIVYSNRTASLSCNESRNRYSNVLANDATRFCCDKLPYINANVVDDRYILTQGPVKNHISDFWTMIFASGAKVILCLTRDSERKKTKFDPYYLDDKEVDFDNYRVNVKSKTVDGNIIIRCLNVSLILDEEIVDTREIVQIQYLGWADFRPPSDINEFSKIFDIIDNIAPNKIVVHCSAGVGRSGTWCAVHRVIEYAKDLLAGRPNSLILADENLLPNLILDLRRNRQGLVQTVDQFEFCYKAIIHQLMSQLRMAHVG